MLLCPEIKYHPLLSRVDFCAKLWAKKLIHFAYCAEFFSGTEEKGNAPDTGESDYSIDNSAEERIHTAADPSDDIKAKKTDATPVKSADDGNDQRDLVHNHFAKEPPFRRFSVELQKDQKRSSYASDFIAAMYSFAL